MPTLDADIVSTPTNAGLATSVVSSRSSLTASPSHGASDVTITTADGATATAVNRTASLAAVGANHVADGTLIDSDSVTVASRSIQDSAEVTTKPGRRKAKTTVRAPKPSAKRRRAAVSPADRPAHSAVPSESVGDVDPMKPRRSRLRKPIAVDDENDADPFEPSAIAETRALPSSTVVATAPLTSSAVFDFASDDSSEPMQRKPSALLTATRPRSNALSDSDTDTPMASVAAPAAKKPRVRQNTAAGGADTTVKKTPRKRKAPEPTQSSDVAAVDGAAGEAESTLDLPEKKAPKKRKSRANLNGGVSNNFVRINLKRRWKERRKDRYDDDILTSVHTTTIPCLALLKVDRTRLWLISSGLSLCCFCTR